MGKQTPYITPTISSAAWTTINNLLQKTATLWSSSNFSLKFVMSNKFCFSYTLLMSVWFVCSGDHDMTFPYMGTKQWINSLNLKVESPWKPWFVHTQVAGWVQVPIYLNIFILFPGTVLHLVYYYIDAPHTFLRFSKYNKKFITK